MRYEIGSGRKLKVGGISTFDLILSITQEALAEAMGVSRNHIANVELGARNTGVWSLLLICGALGVAPAELFADFRGSTLSMAARR